MSALRTGSRGPAVAGALATAALGGFLLLAAGGTALAGETQDAVGSRWRGAWVITTAETHSDCMGMYTGNRVSGRLVSSKGHWRFKPGELAQIDGIDLKRDRIDVKMTLAEPLLAPHQDGPFTLYDEASCRMELQVEVARDLVKGKDVAGLDQALTVAVERYGTEDEARASRRYNRRERDPYPADYEKTVAAHASWQARQTNTAVQARIDALVDDTSRIPDRISTDPDYMAGFAHGVETSRASRPDSCPGLMSIGMGTSYASTGYGAPGAAVPAGRGGTSHVNAAGTGDADAQARYGRGFADGVRLTQGLDAIRRLPGCFLPVPGE
jgi:hypothetical protein